MNLTLIEMHCHVYYLHLLSLRKKEKESPADVSQQIPIASHIASKFFPQNRLTRAIATITPRTTPSLLALSRA